MKFKRIVESALVCTAFVGMLSGCFPTGELSVPDSAPETVEGIAIDVELPDRTPESVPLITLKMREWDHDKLMEMFLGDDTITLDNSYINLNGVMEYIYRAADNSLLTFEDGRIFYQEDGKNKQNPLGSYYQSNYMKYLFPEEEIDGFPREDALEKAHELLDKLDIKNYGEPEIYAATAEYANTLPHGSKWTKDDEVYYIRFPIIYNGIPIIDRMFAVTGTDWIFDGSYAYFIVSKNEILCFWCDGIFDEEQIQLEDIPIEFSAENALDQFKISFSERETDPLTVIGCTLTYMPCGMNGVQEFSFTPAWRIEYFPEPKEKMLAGLKRYIYDANTGVRMMNYTG